MKNQYSSLPRTILTIVLVLVPFSGYGSATAGAAPAADAAKKGLLFYSSELQHERQKDIGWDTRKKVLLDYSTYATGTYDRSLREVGEGDDPASRAVSLSKGGMVFHLLKRLTGEEKFSLVVTSLNKGGSSPALSWDSVRAAFEKETGRDLGWFFKQWVDRKGLPDLRVENVSTQRNGSKFEVSFDLVQNGEVYVLDIPVLISSLRNGSRSESVKLDSEKKHVSLLVDDEPSFVALDRDYDIPRKLWDAETPSRLKRILGEEKPVLISPAKGTEVYAGIIAQWKQRGAVERTAESITDADLRASPFVVFNDDDPLLNRLYGKIEVGEEYLTLIAKKNPWNRDKIVLIVRASSARAADGTMSLLLSSGDESSLVIDARGAVTHHAVETERGMNMELRTEPLAIDVRALTSLTRVIEGAAQKKIVYVGEYHDRYAHHTAQLQVIKTLFQKNHRIAIGMEMFQRPFQQVLDDYVAGVIGEREFLKKSEYFKRWSFDYNLYKPILDFARAEKIPVVALNQRREITDKVAKGGLDSLSADEKKEVPKDLDFSDTDYRDRLKQVFEQHKSPIERNFDNFYEAQILWDETMSFSVDEYLRKNPERQMIVVAGLGHLAYGSGIPKRAFRRNGYEFATILNDADVDRDIADYLVFPQPMEGLAAPKLMAMLKEKDGSVAIADLPEDSVSRKAGIRPGDVLVTLDNLPVRTVEDIKIVLFYKKHDEALTVKVMRKRFLLGDKELSFEVRLQ